MVDILGPKIDMALISEFVEVVTPVEDYRYRWKLNFGPEKLQSERMDLTDPPLFANPVLHCDLRGSESLSSGESHANTVPKVVLA